MYACVHSSHTHATNPRYTINPTPSHTPPPTPSPHTITHRHPSPSPPTGTALISLDLHDNPLTEEVGPSLARVITTHTHLRVLNLNDTSLTDTGVGVLAQALSEGAPHLEVGAWCIVCFAVCMEVYCVFCCVYGGVLCVWRCMEVYCVFCCVYGGVWRCIEMHRYTTHNIIYQHTHNITYQHTPRSCIWH